MRKIQIPLTMSGREIREQREKWGRKGSIRVQRHVVGSSAAEMEKSKGIVWGTKGFCSLSRDLLFLPNIPSLFLAQSLVPPSPPHSLTLIFDN